MTDNEKAVKLRAALRALVEKLDEVHNSPEYMSVWTIWHAHCGDYEGPTYVEEFEAAKNVLWNIRVPKSGEPENSST